MRALRVVDRQVGVQINLHFRHGFVELLAPLQAEVLVQQRPVQPLDEAVALRPADLGRPVIDLLELQEQLVRMLVRATAVLTGGRCPRGTS